MSLLSADGVLCLRMSLRSLALVGLMAHLLVGCGGYQPQVVRTPSAAREEFDPQSLKDDDFLLKPNDTAGQLPAWRPQEEKSRPSPAPENVAEGYRVQIAAVRDRARAEAFRKEAQKQFEQPVYVHYDEDTRLYKIHVGNARSALDAVRLRREAKSRGYREAYVVKTRIQVTPIKVRRPTKIQGFRAQVFSASNQLAAERERDRAKDLLGRQDVYVDFEPPFFKVRVGNCRDRKAAEALVEEVKEKGYETPFIVRSQIVVGAE